MASFKDLRVWQVNQGCICGVASLIDKLPKTLPAKILADQLFRSLTSVGANLAEGYESYQGKEYMRYCNIALRSAVESDHRLTTIESLFPDLSDELKPIASQNIETIKMLKGLIRRIEEKRGSLSPTPTP